jgi:hypothetical protein
MRPAEARAHRHTHVHTRAATRSRVCTTPAAAHSAGRTHTRTHEQRTCAHRYGWTHVVRGMGVPFYAYAQAHAHTRPNSHTARSPTSARVHTHAGAVTLAGVRAHMPAQYSPMSVVPHTRAHTNTSLAGSQMRAHMYTRTNTHTRAHARTRTHTHEHTHTRTFPLTRFDRLALPCVRERVAPQADAAPFGRFRKYASTTWRRRCSRTAPTCTRGPIPGAAGRSLLRATVGVRRGRPGRDRCAAVLDAPTHTRAIHSRTHTRIDVAVCMRLNTHTDARTKARIDISIFIHQNTHTRETHIRLHTCARAHPSTHIHSHTHRHTHRHTHTHTHTQHTVTTHAHGHAARANGWRCRVWVSEFHRRWASAFRSQGHAAPLCG